MSKLLNSALVNAKTFQGNGAAQEFQSTAAGVSNTLDIVKANGRPDGLVAFEREVVAFFVDAAQGFGVPKSVAAIYGICFASADPLCFADISERLQISQGSISQGLRVLREFGALKAVGTRERRDYFSPDLELRKLVSCFLEQRLEKQLEAGRDRLKSIHSFVPCDAGTELRFRLIQLQNWHEKGQALIPIIKAFLKLN